MLPIMKYSPFVPPGREMIFTRAFTQFFGGDYLSAIHILLPQLENSMRLLLKRSGHDPTSISADRTQKDITLSVMLDEFHLELE